MTNVVASESKVQYPDNQNYKELVMQVLVELKFSKGDFEHGFEEIMLCTDIVDCENSAELEVTLPPAPLIPGFYQNWQDKYSELVGTSGRKALSQIPVTVSYTENISRGFSKQQPTNFSYHECQKECNQYAENLRTQINQWLAVIKSKLQTALELDANSEILVTINTENITSQVTKDILHRLPWRKWDYFNSNSTFEVVLCLSESPTSVTHTPSVANPSTANNGIFRRVRITSIYGDSKDINVAEDKKSIAKLEKRGAELIHLDQPQRQDFIALWNKPCDIFVYNGHSESSIDGTVGSLQINSTESLNLQEIRNTFREAIRKGLQIVILNSCDGLGLAKQLADLHLPYIIVWREPVPDKIAQKFLQYFLSSYAEGKSLFHSVTDARIKLVELTNSAEKEKQIPGLEWLPIICKNTELAPPTWEDLGGLTGKLPDCPYQGLSAFGEENKDVFFGRDDVVADSVEAVNSKALVPVIGPSGSGKSSVVFAGLVPQLRDLGNVQIVSFRPGKNPFDALAVALNRILNIELNHNRLEELELRVNLEHDEKALCELIEHLNYLTPQPPSLQGKGENLKPLSSQERGSERGSPRRFVLIADQFEELYTLTEDSLRQPFLDLLLYAVQNAPAFSLVLTLRADFMGKALDYQPMGEAFKKYGTLLLTPMKREELQAAIEQPAAKMKVELERGLTSKLIDDLGNQRGCLPLLEFTLLQLWEKHDKWYLTHQAYKEIGGLKQALVKYADGIINPLSAVEKEKAERIFIQLIRPGEGTEDTKRKATRGEVGENNWGLVEELANQRLVVTGWDKSNQQETVEIIHEALIREWGMLRGWIQSNRRFRIWQERLQFEVVKWDKSRDEKYLLSGGNLGEAEGWYFDQKYRDYLSDIQGEFIRESLDVRDRKIKEEKKKQRRTILGFASFSIVSLTFAGFAGFYGVKAQISATQEKLNSSIATSKNSFNLQNYGDAQFEALKAKQLLETTWWQQWIPTHIKQKVDIALHQLITSPSVAKHSFKGHKEAVYDVRFSPDRKTIASASLDKTVKLWSVDGQLLHTLQGHKEAVYDVRFSPDGKTIASASGDKTVKLWSVDGQLLHSLSGHKSDVSEVRFSPDGKTIASASGDKTVKLWSVDGQLLHTLQGHKSSVYEVRFSPDGKTIATASNDTTVKLWSVDGQLLHSLQGHTHWVRDVRFSPDGKTIASAGGRTVKLWSVDGQLLHTLQGHKSPVYDVRFSPDGKTIASAGGRTVKLWSVDGQLLHTLQGHKSSVYEVRFSPDGKTIATASADGTVKLWSVDGQLLHSFKGHKDLVYSVRFSPDGKTIASASRDKTVKLWSVDGQLLHSFKGHKSDVSEVKFSPDGKTIASSSRDGTVKLWSVDGQLLHSLQGHKSEVISVEFSPDGKTIASASGDGTVKLWSVDGQFLHSLDGHKSEVSSVRFSPDGKTIASASGDRTVKLWSVDGQLLHSLQGHKSYVYSVRFSPDGKTIASAGGRTVKLWSVDGQLLHSLDGHKSEVISVEFSPDGKTIASASGDRTVKLWSVNGQLLHSFKGHKAEVFRVRFSPDGKIIASASWDNTVKLWSVSGQLLHTLEGHKDRVFDVRFSPDGKTIASASEDKTVKLWSVDGQLLHSFKGHKAEVFGVRFSPDGKIIASASWDNTVKLWNWNLDNLLTRGCNKFQGYLVERPKKLEELKACQNPEILTKAAYTLVQQGEELAKKGDSEGAVAKFRKAKKWNPKLDINPEEKAKFVNY
ncbi:WD-repeat protein [Calothrix parasitica NIES-267]|uniref:WD-repeat protein n=1 Tax=Calothrix parasitica NIES-267 TaxID=1973488 RepID=A0A1Z4LU45_9CYAN|nr:WD-repeat protein [Calothrix parasitica NIES-267]